MNQVKLSIIIPTYNSAQTVGDTLNSIIQQQWNNIECWIIDGNSSDNTIELIKPFSERHSFIKYISEPDKGVYDAMNKGIKLAQGDYLYFMGSDDVFYNKNVLSDIFLGNYFDQYDVIYGDAIFKHSGIRYGEEKTYLKLIKGLENISHQAIFYSKKVFSIVGDYDLNFPVYADFNLNVRCFKDDSISKKYLAKPVCIFNEKGISFFQRSKDKYIENLHEFYVNDLVDKVALYDTVQFQQNKINALLSSKDYLLGKRIGNLIRKFRKIFRF